MSLTTAVRTAVEAIAAAHSEFAVTVVIDGTSGTGLRVGEEQATDFGPQGETGSVTARVRVSGATFPTRPTRGHTIIVDGEDVIVTRVEGVALWVIDYQVARPVTGT